MEAELPKHPLNADPTLKYLGPDHTYAEVTDRLGGIPLTAPLKTPLGWTIGFVIALAFLAMYLFSLGVLLTTGIGVWGNNQPVGWGFDIINFVWWIGIGHAGTLIAAILLLLKQEWRTSINRFAESMTLFAVACAGIYPLIHTGRWWLDYWFLPYPNPDLVLWPQFRSPLAWDVFAISTYATVSVLFWSLGLIPDMASLRDRATNKWVKWFYGALALGWRGSAVHWHRYELASLILAGISTPLVVSVHSIISFDFAVGVVPGWHVTIFPPYFVAGAVYAGFALVLLLMIPIRAWYNLKDFVTMNHIDVMCKVMLTTGLVVVYGYFLEIFFAWYSANEYEQFVANNRFFGVYAWSYWGLLLCNFAIPQVLWFRRFRRNLPVVMFVCIAISIGMWLERFVIIPMSLTADFLPSSWGYYDPTIWDFGVYIGSFGLFFTGMFLYIRFLPMMPIFEIRMLVNSVNSLYRRMTGREYGRGGSGAVHEPATGD
jgi:Ni/Fe-hydrogenase subunit HybB-like protein